MLFLHSVFVFWVFLFTEWEQSFPSLIIRFFIFSELVLVSNSGLHEDIHTQMCSVLFVRFILISCIPAVPHPSSPSLLHQEWKWWCDIISLLLLLYYSLIVFSFFLFRFSSFSFPSHTSFIHARSFQTLISPSTANGLVDTSKKERKIRKSTSVKRNSVHNDGWTVLTLIHSFIHFFIHLFPCLFIRLFSSRFWAVMKRKNHFSLILSHFPLWEENEKWYCFLFFLFSLIFLNYLFNHLLYLVLYFSCLFFFIFVYFYFILSDNKLLFIILIHYQINDF